MKGKSMSVTCVTTKITIQLVCYTSNQSIQTLIRLSCINVTMKTVSLQPSGRITWLLTSRLSTNVWTTVVISTIIGVTGKAKICLLMCFYNSCLLFHTFSPILHLVPVLCLIFLSCTKTQKNSYMFKTGLFHMFPAALFLFLLLLLLSQLTILSNTDKHCQLSAVLWSLSPTAGSVCQTVPALRSLRLMPAVEGTWPAWSHPQSNREHTCSVLHYMYALY